MRHSFANWALEVGLSIVDLSRYTGTSVEMIHRTYDDQKSQRELWLRSSGSSCSTRLPWATSRRRLMQRPLSEISSTYRSHVRTVRGPAPSLVGDDERTWGRSLLLLSSRLWIRSVSSSIERLVYEGRPAGRTREG